MTGNMEIRKAFEIADDGLQSSYGYWLYLFACQRSINTNDVYNNLSGNLIKITHNWVREMKANEFIKGMEIIFPELHSRMCLINIVGIFENSLTKMIGILNSSGITTTAKNMPINEKSNYKPKLIWMFEFLENEKTGMPQIDAQIPDDCLDIDHARRIRNLISHNHGNFNKMYETDIIKYMSLPPIIKPEYSQYDKVIENQIRCPLNPEDVEKICLSHTEILHCIYNKIQISYFGETKRYDYRAEKKGLDWFRCLLGS